MKILVYKFLLILSGLITKVEFIESKCLSIEKIIYCMANSQYTDMNVSVMLGGKIIQFEDGASLFKIKLGNLRKEQNNK